MERYAAISITEMYGPETRYGLLGVYDTEEEAQAIAAAHDPDYDPTIKCVRLRPNQASGERGEVREVIEECSESILGGIWDALPDDLVAALEAVDPDDPEAIYYAALDAGYIELADDHGCYIVRV